MKRNDNNQLLPPSPPPPEDDTTETAERKKRGRRSSAHYKSLPWYKVSEVCVCVCVLFQVVLLFALLLQRQPECFFIQPSVCLSIP